MSEFAGFALGVDYTTKAIKVARIESTVPTTFRVAQYPDGSRRIQGAYQWSEGWQGGITWRDLPMVDVDENGNEVMK